VTNVSETRVEPYRLVVLLCHPIPNKTAAVILVLVEYAADGFSQEFLVYPVYNRARGLKNLVLFIQKSIHRHF
jgi:hypothetical protein